MLEFMTEEEKRVKDLIVQVSKQLAESVEIRRGNPKTVLYQSLKELEKHLDDLSYA